MNYAKLLLLSVTLYAIPALSIEENLPTISLEEAIKTSNPKAVASFIRHLEPLDSKKRETLLNLAQTMIESRQMMVNSIDKGAIHISEADASEYSAYHKENKPPNLTYYGIALCAIGLAGFILESKQHSPSFVSPFILCCSIIAGIIIACSIHTTLPAKFICKKYVDAVFVKFIIAKARVVDVNAVAAKPS